MAEPTHETVKTSVLAGLIGIDVLGRWYSVPIVYAIYCAVAIVGLLFLQETRDLHLEELDEKEAAAA